MKRLALFIVVLSSLCLPLALGIAADKGAAPVESFEVKALWDAFSAKRAETEARLLETEIIVTGVVTDTGMSRYMTPCVYLAEKADSPVIAICVLPRVDALKLSDFSKGEKVSLIGRVYRFGDRGVVLKQCKRYTPQAG